LEISAEKPIWKGLLDSAWALLEPKLGVSGCTAECHFNPIAVLQLYFSSFVKRESSPLCIFLHNFIVSSEL